MEKVYLLGGLMYSVRQTEVSSTIVDKAKEEKDKEKETTPRIRVNREKLLRKE